MFVYFFRYIFFFFLNVYFFRYTFTLSLYVYTSHVPNALDLPLQISHFSTFSLSFSFSLFLLSTCYNNVSPLFTKNKARFPYLNNIITLDIHLL